MDTDPRFLEELRRCHGYGMTDRGIARKMGVHRLTVLQWRKRYNLPTNWENDPADNEDDDCYARAAAYRSICCGNDDEAVSAEVGIPLETARRYRAEMPDWWCRGYEDAERIGGDHDD